MGRVTARRPASHLTADAVTTRPETLAVEEPLELRVNGSAITVTMRTPGADVELAQGFLLTEGVIGQRDDIATVQYCRGVGDDGANTYNVLDVTMAPGIEMPDLDVTRNFYTTSSCGVCGKGSIDAVRTISRHSPGDDPTVVAAETLWAMPDQLRTAQRVFASTGGLHGAALFDADGTMLVVREDIGRHNAVDKVIGWAVEQRADTPGGRGATGERAGLLRTHAEGHHGGHPDARRGLGAVLARGRSGQSGGAHPGGVPAGRIHERLHPTGPRQARRITASTCDLHPISTQPPSWTTPWSRNIEPVDTPHQTNEGAITVAKILIAACPPIGHVAPLLNVARGLVNRGNDVDFLTSARHAGKVRAVGATPHPLPYGADFDDSTLDADLPGRAETSGVARVNFDVKHVFVRSMPHQAAALEELIAEHTSTPSSPTPSSSAYCRCCSRDARLGRRF